MKFSDDELIVLYASGHNEAFDMLYERYRHRIFRFALTSLNNRADAEEIVQEVFIRVTKAASRYKPRGFFQAWIFRIASNQIKSFISIKQKNSIINSSIISEEFYFEEDNRQNEKNKVQRESLLNSLNELTYNQKMVIILKEVEGLGSKEIAQTLDISYENVRLLLHRGRKKLFSLLFQV